MTFRETLEWQRHYSTKIKYLASQGDLLSLKLITAYRDLYAHQLDPKLQENWMKICDDWVRRSLTITTREILQERYGLHIPGEQRRLQ